MLKMIEKVPLLRPVNPRIVYERTSHSPKKLDLFEVSTLGRPRDDGENQKCKVDERIIVISHATFAEGMIISLRRICWLMSFTSP